MSRIKDHLGDAPPTIGGVRRLGASSIVATCNPPCRRWARIGLDALRLPDETPFIEITARRRLICASCGRRASKIEVDWEAIAADTAP